MTAASDLIDALTRRRLTIAVAESLTGGLVLAELIAVPGASVVVRGGVVAYATDLKASLLGVDARLLQTSGPVDERVAIQMAAGVRTRLGADLGVATTGVAGPDFSGGFPPGTVWLGFALGDELSGVGLTLGGDRHAIRGDTVSECLLRARQLLPE